MAEEEKTNENIESAEPVSEPQTAAGAEPGAEPAVPENTEPQADAAEPEAEPAAQAAEPEAEPEAEESAAEPEAESEKASDETKSAEPAPAPVHKRDRSKIYKEPTNGGSSKSDKDGGKSKKKKKEPGKIRRWFKDFFSELKKVTWPSFTKVLKQTGIVLAVTVIFLLVLMAFDSLFGYLYKLLVSGLTAETVTAFASALFGGGLL